MNAKTTALRLLRETRTLAAADTVRLAIHRARARSINKRFTATHPGFAVPPHALCFETYGHVRADLYYTGGKQVAGMITDLIAAHAAPARESGLSVLDWGCGCARVVRHLATMLPAGSSVFGTDVDREAISWCTQNIQGISFSLNRLTPPLPYADCSFDCIYAISVLNHLSEPLHHRWRDEVHRLLKPKGLLIVSVNGDRLLSILTGQEQSLYKDGRLVARAKVKEGTKWFTSFQGPLFMRKLFSDGFEVAEHIDRSPMRNRQDVWVLRKKSAADKAGR